MSKHGRSSGGKAPKRKATPRRTISRAGDGRRPAPKEAPLGKVRILVADDQAIDRKGLTALLQSVSDFEVVAECSSADDAVLRCKALSPSVVILALRLPAPAGRTALSVIREQSPATRVLALAERGEGHCMVLNPPRVGRHPPRDNPGCAHGTDCLQLAVAEGATGTIRRSAEPRWSIERPAR